MIAGLDSAQPPTVAQVDLARANGVHMWSGYIATVPNVGLERVWTLAEFDVVRRLDGRPLAYCSGWDSPIALRQLADEWDVLLTLDLEDGIRSDGGWVPAFLTVSGAGLYGTRAIHRYAAPFHILAGYPGHDPNATWPNDLTRPDAPCGWQWEGTHTESGASVDRGWFDDWFLGDDMFNQTDRDNLTRVLTAILGGKQMTQTPDGAFHDVPPEWGNWLRDRLNGIDSRVNNIAIPPVNVDSLAGSLAPLLAPHLLDVPAFAVALMPLIKDALPPAVDPAAIANAVALVLSRKLST